MPYHGFYTRSYTLPLDLFGKIENDAEAEEVLSHLFDSRYLKRDRIRLTTIEPIRCEIEGFEIDLNFWALVHIMGGTTIIVELRSQNELPTHLMTKIQDHWLEKEPIFAFADDVKVSIRAIMNAALIEMLAAHATEFKQFRGLSFEQIIDTIIKWTSFYEKLFEITKYSDLRFKMPTIFGCITIVIADIADIAGEGRKRTINSPIVRHLEPDMIADDDEERRWKPMSGKHIIKVNRNSAIIVTPQFSDTTRLYIMQLAFLNIVRHYANFLVGETSTIMDSIGRINVSFKKRLYKKKMLVDRFKLRDIIDELSILKSGFIGAYDETKDISLWNSPDLVDLSRSVRRGGAWRLDKEIDLAIAKTEELEELTDLLYKDEVRRSKRFIIPVVSAIGIVNLLQTIPVIKQHIIPNIEIWGPVVSILMIVVVVYQLMEYR